MMSRKLGLRWRAGGLAATLLATLPAAAVPAEISWLTPGDESVLRSVSPKGLELMKAGEEARLRGDAERAIALYAQANDVYKMREEPLRFTCKLLSELGRREQAITACKKAVEQDTTEAALSAQVGAAMSGTGRLTMDELFAAERTTRALLRRAPRQPWGYAAKADIARRIGDTLMLSSALDDLRRFAPGHYETTRVERLVAARRSPYLSLAGWALLAAAGAVTAVHALARRLRGRGAARAAQVAALLLVALVTRIGVAQEGSEPSAVVPSEAAPQKAGEGNITYGLSQWGVDNDDPIRSLPTAAQRDKNPLEFGYHLMDVGERADIAIAKQDYAGAIKYYRALATAVPDMSISWVKICEMHEKLGQRAEALEACGTALTKENLKLENYELYARVMLSKRGDLTPGEKADLAAVVDHLKTQEPAKKVAARLECELAVRTDDVKRLEGCTAELGKLEPNAPATVTYQWSLALQHQDYDRALGLIEVAKKAGVPPAGVAKMEKATRSSLPLWRQPGRLVIAVVGLLAALGALFFLMRRRRALPVAVPLPASASSS
jgi:tetratricopeptide (TPR) repeat protein